MNPRTLGFCSLLLPIRSGKIMPTPGCSTSNKEFERLDPKKQLPAGVRSPQQQLRGSPKPSGKAQGSGCFLDGFPNRFDSHEVPERLFLLSTDGGGRQKQACPILKYCHLDQKYLRRTSSFVVKSILDSLLGVGRDNNTSVLEFKSDARILYRSEINQLAPSWRAQQTAA